MNEDAVKILAETDLYGVLLTYDEAREKVYHLEMENVTVHFFAEEWDEFLELMKQVLG